MSEKKREMAQILTKPFPSELIKKKPPGLDYVEAGHYVRRLNKAFDHMWSLEVVEHWTEIVKTRKGDKMYVMVRIRITTESITKESFGGHLCATGEIADAYKSAVTDGMKKASWMMGLGVQNWLDEDEDLHEEKKRRSDLIARTKEILDKSGLTKNGLEQEKENFLKKHFGTTSAKYIFSKFSMDELESCIDQLESDLKKEDK